MPLDPHENLERFDHAIARWNAGDLDGYLALYDDAVRLHGYAPEPLDRAGVRTFYEAVVASLSGPGRRAPGLAVHERFRAGDRIVCRFSMRGVHTGPFMGVPASGRPYAIEAITVLRFAGGRCVERWSQADLLGLMVQLGAVPAPAG